MAVYEREGTVMVDFGKKVAWLGLDERAARELAALLIKHADQLQTVVG
jgi:hypothetical protein